MWLGLEGSVTYRYISLLLCLLFIVLPRTSEAQQTMQFGVNLAGAEFGQTFIGRYGTDYIYPTAAELDYYKSKGLTLIRLPFAWERMQPTLNSQLDGTQIGHMTAFLNAADARGMNVILDAHNYGRYGHGAFSDVTNHGDVIGSKAVPIAAFADFWYRIAVEFQRHPSLMGYDLMNEPHDMGNPSVWPTAAQAAVNAIRRVDAARYVIIQGDDWATSAAWLTSNNANLSVNDPAAHILYEAHQYFDHDDRGVYAGSYEQEGAYPTIGVDRLQPFATWLSQHRYNGLLGEYGVPNNDRRWLTVLDHFLTAVRQHGMWGTYWAGGPLWRSYQLSCEPQANGTDAAQMTIVQKYPSVSMAGRSG